MSEAGDIFLLNKSEILKLAYSISIQFSQNLLRKIYENDVCFSPLKFVCRQEQFLYFSSLIIRLKNIVQSQYCFFIWSEVIMWPHTSRAVKH